MTIREFGDAIIGKLRERVDGVKEIRMEHVLKNNSVTVTSLIFVKDKGNMYPNIYLDGYYQDYLDGTGMREIIQQIICCYETDSRHNSVDMTFFDSWEIVKDKVSFKLINQKWNQELLENVPHKNCMDLAMVFYIPVEEYQGTVLIKNEHCSHWGIAPEDLIKAASKNTPRLHPMRLRTMQEMLSGILADHAESADMWVLSNQEQMFGAATLLYPESMVEIAKCLQSDFYILPSSIHEVMIVRANAEEQAEWLKKIVQEVNGSVLDKEDMLGENVYRYSREDKRLMVAA